MKRASHELVSETALPPSAGTGLNPRWATHEVKWPARTVLTILAVWTAMGLFEAVPDMLDGFKWNETIGKLIEAWSWALLTPLILLLDRKLTLANLNVLQLAGAHLVLSVPFAVVHAYLAGLLMYPVPTIWWNPLRSTEFAVYFYLGGWVTYCAFVAALQAFKFHNSLLISQIALERVEKRLTESQLNALRLQLEPHFLFNTLNAISSEVTADPELAREMIENLGALLRQSLDCQDSMEITLAQELALLDHYISIQKLRFGDRISIRVEVEPGVLTAKVPSMLLQPLVENAVRHGVEKKLSGGTIIVSARQSRGKLHIKVLDDGMGLPRQWRMESCAGLGVRVTRERLQTLHGQSDADVFSISRRRGGGTQVVIRIPLTRTGAEAVGSAP